MHLTRTAALAAGTLFCFALASGIEAQTPAKALSFDVASVRPGPPGQGYSANEDLDSNAPWHGNAFTANAIPMVYLVFAYNLTGSVEGRAVWDRLPPWAKSEFFRIDARAHAGVTRDEMRGMMRSLLAERFQLKAHVAPQQHDVFVFSLVRPGSPGPALRPSDAAHPCITDPDRPTRFPAPSTGKPLPRYCGVSEWQDGNTFHLQILGETLEEITTDIASAAMEAGYLTPHAGADATALPGTYDLDLQFARVDGADEAAEAPSFTNALRRQAGLKMVSRTQSVSVLIVDHIERPSAQD